MLLENCSLFILFNYSFFFQNDSENLTDFQKSPKKRTSSSEVKSPPKKIKKDKSKAVDDEDDEEKEPVNSNEAGMLQTLLFFITLYLHVFILAYLLFLEIAFKIHEANIEQIYLYLSEIEHFESQPPTSAFQSHLTYGRLRRN